MSPQEQRRDKSNQIEVPLQICLALLGLVGALARAFAPIRAKDAAWPVIDATTLGWLALIVVAYLLRKSPR